MNKERNRFCEYFLDEHPEKTQCQMQDCECPYKKDKTWKDCDDYEPRK